MPADLRPLLADLTAEHASLEALVASLDARQLLTPTPAEPWTVRDQVTHLGYYDDRATVAITDAPAFARHVAELLDDPVAVLEGHLRTTDGLDPAGLLAWWRERRASLLAAVAGADPAIRVPWYGPPMGLASMVTARLMETWCHGQDVADALAITRAPTARLRHVAHIAVAARGFSFAAHGRSAPADPVHVELSGPDGDTWRWGEVGAAGGTVRATALDFALLACQRRHRDDVDVRAEGPVATAWLDVIQAYAGPPGPGRSPLVRAAQA